MHDPAKEVRDTIINHAELTRTCEICNCKIEDYNQMIDLFRRQSSVEGTQFRVKWVHKRCAQKAIETWLIKKWDREKTTTVDTPQE